MRVKIASDLHLEFANCKFQNSANADLLVLAGDIFVANRWKSQYDKFLNMVTDEFPNILYIMGNHEHYCGDFSRTENILREKFSKYSNFHFLNNEKYETQEIIFWGGTLWTDLHNNDPMVCIHGQSAMNDYKVIHYKDRALYPSDIYESNQKAMNSLQDFLCLNKRCVVISHHAPSMQSIDEKYKAEPYLNYLFANQLDFMIEHHPQIVLWVHGHVHNNSDYYVGNTRVVCNPRGYSGQEVHTNTWKLQVIDV